MIVKLSSYEIYFSDEVIQIFKSYIQNERKKPEAGGILFGQVLENKIYILKASIPTKFDKANRTSFERSREVAQILVNYEFYNSNRRIIYLGEWHTHPENNPSPSFQDRKMIKEQINLGKPNEEYLLLIIQGITHLYIGIYNDNELVSCTISNS